MHAATDCTTVVEAAPLLSKGQNAKGGMTHCTQLLQGSIVSIHVPLLDQALSQIQHLREVVTGMSQLLVGHTQYCCISDDAF